MDSKPYDKKAAAEILISPARVVASRIDDSVGSILISLVAVTVKYAVPFVEARYFTWPDAASDRFRQAGRACLVRPIARRQHRRQYSTYGKILPTQP
ncbi:MAG: hypothetical protein ACOVN8_03870, partial [Burkholderiaceae bacterium]